jgi:DNA-directed RNA polymerase subunit F
MAEVKSKLSKSENKEENKALHDYLKKFSKRDKAKADNLYKEIQALNNPKIKDDNIAKIVDFLPKDTEDVNKIFTDVSLTEEEANKIVELVSKY